MIKNPEKKFLFIAAAVLLLIVGFPLFVNLGKAPIYMWDEATYANNAIDMYLTHDPIVVRVDGKPDLYNTKPPLVLWMQVLAMRIFGMNEFALRLPSALLAALTMFLMMWFSVNVLNSFLTGSISVLTLACSAGYVSNHGTRSGDLDAALVFWITLYTLTYLKYLFQKQRPGLHFSIVTLGLVGAFYSKGIAGLFFVPFLFLITLIRGDLSGILKRKETYVSAFIVFLFCAGYYFIRERAAPGYWNTVLKSEFGRYGHVVMSWHAQPFGFYFNNLVEKRFTPFIYLLPLSLAAGFMTEDIHLKRILFYLWIISIGYFFLITFPADKLEWYDEPLFPFLSLILGISISVVVEKLVALLKAEKKIMWRFSISLLAILIIFIFPYRNIIQFAITKDRIRYDWDTSQTDIFRINGAYMKYLHEHFPQDKNYTVFKSIPYDPEHEDQPKFYQRAYEINDSNSIGIKHSVNELKAGELLLVCEKTKLDSLQMDFDISILNSWNGCEFIRIEQLKK